MTAKQTTWRKSNEWKTVGTVKGRKSAVQVCVRAPGKVELHLFNRILPYASEQAAKDFCETLAFLETYDLFASQWSTTPAVSTQAALESAAQGYGRGCISAPETFTF